MHGARTGAITDTQGLLLGLLQWGQTLAKVTADGGLGSEYSLTLGLILKGSRILVDLLLMIELLLLVEVWRATAAVSGHGVDLGGGGGAVAAIRSGSELTEEMTVLVVFVVVHPVFVQLFFYDDDWSFGFGAEHGVGGGHHATWVSKLGYYPQFMGN